MVTACNEFSHVNQTGSYLIIDRQIRDIAIMSRSLKAISNTQMENVLTKGLLVCLFVLRFYGQVNPMESCRALSVYLTTLILSRLSPFSG